MQRRPWGGSWRAAAVAGLVIVAVLVVGDARPAAACSCAGFDDAEALAHADVVFTGELVEVVRPGSWSSPEAPARFVFDVDEVLVGEARARQSIVTPAYGASCGLEIEGPGPFLVFATERSTLTDDADGELHSHLCSGTRPLADGPIGFVAEGRPPTPGSSPVGGGGGVPVPLVVGGIVLALVVVAVGATLLARARRPS